MAPATSATNQRPFTAIMLQHKDLQSVADLPRLLKAGSIPPVNEFLAGEWTVWRWEFIHHRNLYSDKLAVERKRDGGWAHDIYIAQRFIDGESYLALASPYVRLLRQLDEDLKGALRQRSAILYGRVDMPKVYAAFQSGNTDLSASRITLEILDEKVLDVVSLTGKNPLNSKLHQKIKAVAAPYAIRVELAEENKRARLSVDRVGNLWWFQSNEAKTELVFQALDKIIGMNAIGKGRRFPLDLKYKKSDEQDKEDQDKEDQDKEDQEEPYAYFEDDE